MLRLESFGTGLASSFFSTAFSLFGDLGDFSAAFTGFFVVDSFFFLLESRFF